MILTPAQSDRAAGVLLGTAVGDALGVPYEFAPPLAADEIPVMKGGGLGPFEPGEWSDDTSMAMAIADVVATGADLTSPDALDAIATNFLRWLDDDPRDIGNQTSAVLYGTRHRLDAEPGIPAGLAMREEALSYSATHPRSAGNGALMRTAPVALAHVDNRVTLAAAARAVAGLTHADAYAGDSCVLWCEAIRVAVIEGHIDVRSGLDLLPDDRRREWSEWLDDAHTRHPNSFAPNGYTVVALQAAAAAIIQTPVPADIPENHLRDALYTAIRIGHDTDTVAAIAGGLLGARWGGAAVPENWRRDVFGWPVVDGKPRRFG
ncbi:MAG: ADP-ribosylglycohydrolase family protein [Gordonia sp. (in: high G+C Gram-positive bacteria)]